VRIPSSTEPPNVMVAERDLLGLSTKKYGALTVGGNYPRWPKDSTSPARVEKPKDIVPAIKDRSASHGRARRSCSSSWSIRPPALRAGGL